MGTVETTTEGDSLGVIVLLRSQDHRQPIGTVLQKNGTPCRHRGSWVVGRDVFYWALS